MDKLKDICYIIGAACNDKKLNFSPKKNDIVIAADGGYDLLELSEISPDVTIGDFDSITTSVDNKDVIKYPVEKDDTDSFLAYKFGYEKGFRNFVIYGGTGGRFDHTIANLQMLCNMAKNKCRGFLIGENTIITAIHNAKIVFNNKNEGKFGVFAFGNDAKGVDILNAKYVLKNGDITPFFPLGVSNEFIGENTSIKVSSGTLLIIWYESETNFLNNIATYTNISKETKLTK